MLSVSVEQVAWREEGSLVGLSWVMVRPMRDGPLIPNYRPVVCPVVQASFSMTVSVSYFHDNYFDCYFSAVDTV